MFFDHCNVDLLNDDDVGVSAQGTINAYNRGYNCGITWPEEWNHKPGGPSVWGGRDCWYCDGKGCDRQTSPRFTCRQWMAYCRQSRNQHDAWMKGWEAGYKKKNKKYNVEEHIRIEAELNAQLKS